MHGEIPLCLWCWQFQFRWRARTWSQTLSTPVAGEKRAMPSIHRFLFFCWASLDHKQVNSIPIAKSRRLLADIREAGATEVEIQNLNFSSVLLQQDSSVRTAVVATGLVYLPTMIADTKEEFGTEDPSVCVGM